MLCEATTAKSARPAGSDELEKRRKPHSIS